MPVKTYPVNLIEAHMLTDNVKHFSFICNESTLNQFTPGQFITMHFEKEGKMLRRSYSLANRRPDTGQLEFAASYVTHGPASEKLFNLEPNDTININGPFGRLVLKDEPVKRYILIATSTGVTPYRAMLSSLEKKLDENKELEVIILQGVQYRKDVLYCEEFLEFAKQNQRGHFFACLSQEKDTLKEHEHAGYCQTKLEALNPDPERDIVYLCGNPAMVDDSFNLLKSKDFEIKQIRREKYISR